MNPAPLSLTTPLRPFPVIALGLALFAPSLRADADDVYWNAATGSWGTLANWADESGEPFAAFPASGTGDYFLTNGTEGARAETTFPAGAGNRNIGSLTIGAFNTLYITGTSPTGSAGSPRVVWFSNAGVVETGASGADVVRMELSHSSGGTITNTGTLAAAQGMLRLQYSYGVLNNTDGLLLARAGTVLNVLAGSNANRIENGTLRSEAGGVVEVGGTAGVVTTVRLTGVGVDNSGGFRVVQSGINSSSSRTVAAVLDGNGTFANTAVMTVLNTGSGNSTGSTAHHARFDVSGNASFTNTGTVSVRNDTTKTSGAATFSQGATFAVAATASFTSTGTIEVLHDSAADGAFSEFTSARSLTNQGLVHVRGNASGSGASFRVTGDGNSYLQAGAGVRTVLERGGLLSAENILIEAGDLGGAGTVSGIDTIIGSGARVVVGDTLSAGAGAGSLVFDSHLTFDAGSSVLFALGADTAGSGRVILGAGFDLAIGENVAVNFTDLDGSAVAGTTYRLFSLDGGSLSGSFVLGDAPEGWAGYFTEGGGFVDFTLTGTAVPEPASAALLLGLGAAAMAGLRRRGARA